MLTPLSRYVLISMVLGLGMAIPSNACIVIVYLGSLRKKGKLSPSDVIFMAKGIVNVLLQGVLSVQGMLLVLCPAAITIGELFFFLLVLNQFLMYYSFWMSAWLSAHYCTSITNLSCGIFIWVKGIVTHFIGNILFLTGLGMLPVTLLVMWAVTTDSSSQSPENRTMEASFTSVRNYVNLSYFVPVTFLGCVLPFCLSLLCLVLTFSFLVRHIWRVRSNDSGSTHPNLRAHVTALRTIFFLLFTLTSFSMSQVILCISENTKISDSIIGVSWTLRLLSPSVEAATIFQASNKLKRILLRRFWSRSWRSAET